jgi:hypothetical protein
MFSLSITFSTNYYNSDNPAYNSHQHAVMISVFVAVTCIDMAMCLLLVSPGGPFFLPIHEGYISIDCRSMNSTAIQSEPE